MVIQSAEVAEWIRRASEFGFTASLQSVSFKFVTTRTSSTVDAESSSIRKNVHAGKNPVLFKGRGKFAGKYIVEVNGELIKGKKIVIAAGARPSIPPYPRIRQGSLPNQH